MELPTAQTILHNLSRYPPTMIISTVDNKYYNAQSTYDDVKYGHLPGGPPGVEEEEVEANVPEHTLPEIIS